ncbi:B3 domain-containing protein REM5-like isoform X2 [Lotus japonicus]|uniref:B3 domain-containing protein REM5-like isoform X2 n=1 Tax=Lotus japonicus TaxID=34305 RepID=UPI00258CE81B|nr:B3 domain-containing protein REM5-like isoform X2 [Lotus japonicus]
MTCNKRDKHSAIRFFKIITTRSLEAGKLMLPNGFTREHGGDVSNPVFLKPPDDKDWKIHWTKHEDGYIWFEKGWKEFASYYSLDHGYLLLFEYNKHSDFGVHIFDKSTLEIEYPFQGYKDEPDNLGQINADLVQSLDERTSCKKRKLKSPMSSSQPSKKLRPSTSGDVGRRSKSPKLPQHVKGHHQSQGTEFEELDENVSGDSLECLKWKELTSKITKASNRARTITSKNPSFKVVIKPAYANKYIRVTSEFAEKHLKNKRGEIILHVKDGRTWPVKYVLEKGTISAGWKKFVSDNNLKVGDVCVFELTKSQPLSLKVSIFPPGGESDQPHSPPSLDSVHGNGVNGLDPARIIDVENETTITRKGEILNSYVVC